MEIIEWILLIAILILIAFAAMFFAAVLIWPHWMLGINELAAVVPLAPG
jgi:hypothetical protein